MPSSASCRDHPRIREDASEPHRAFGAYPAGLGVAHVFESSVREALKARRLPGVLDDWCPSCPRHFFASAARARFEVLLERYGKSSVVERELVA